MKLVKYIVFLSIALVQQAYLQASAAASCTKSAHIPYEKELQSLSLPNTDKEYLLDLWRNLYLGYAARAEGTAWAKSQQYEVNNILDDWNALKLENTNLSTNPFCTNSPLNQNPTTMSSEICLTPSKGVNETFCKENIKNMYDAIVNERNTNNSSSMHLTRIQQYLDPKNFKPLAKKTETAYATKHLYKAVQRLASTCHLSVENYEPKTSFTGDIRDLGIIVNIQNNTNTSFSIIQSSIDGKVANEIGKIAPGLNGVNLHTAALQGPKLTKSTIKTTDMWYLAPLGVGSSHPLIQIKIMSGTELINFIKTFPQKKPGIFELNGNPIDAEHIAIPGDWFLVLMQVPKTGQPEECQRIQVLDISQLNNPGPWLMTLLINQQEQKKPGDPIIFQPSMNSVQTFPETSKENPRLPLILLPDFLWNQPILQAYWMIMTTAYICAQTDFAFFNTTDFGNAMKYYELLSYFDESTQSRIVIDKYNIFQKKLFIKDTPWIMESGLYQTNLKNASDIPITHIFQDNAGNFVTNASSGEYINFSLTMHNQSNKNNSFDMQYTIPYQNTFIYSISKILLKKGIILSINNVQNNLTITLRDPNEHILYEQKTTAFGISKRAHIDFLNHNDDWIGTTIDATKSQDFNLFYKENNTKTKHYLYSKPLYSMNSVDTIHTVTFSQYPLEQFSFEFYHTINVNPYIKHNLIKNKQLPEFFAKLTKEDWQQGVYFTTSLKNNVINLNFYNNNKSFLGSEISSDNKIDINSIKKFNIKINNTKQYDINFSPNIALLLKYSSNK